jgi:hypothetical protein
MEQNNQVTTKVQSTTKQKLVLALAVFGLIGFGLMVAFIADMPTKTTISENAKTYIFYGKDKQDIETQILAKAESMNLKNLDTNVLDQIIAGIDESSPDYIPNLKCGGCSLPDVRGICGVGACWGGHVSSDEIEIHVGVSTDGWF